MAAWGSEGGNGKHSVGCAEAKEEVHQPQGKAQMPLEVRPQAQEVTQPDP